MEKPITVAREELMQAIIDAVNASGLPAFVSAEILEKLHTEAEDLAARQYEQDKTEWDMHKLGEETE